MQDTFFASADLLSLFVSSLEVDDCTVTKYRGCRRERKDMMGGGFDRVKVRGRDEGRDGVREGDEDGGKAGVRVEKGVSSQTFLTTGVETSDVGVGVGVGEEEVVDDDAMTGDEKVNTICKAVRNALLPILHTPNNTNAIYPILCTFAKNRPAMLVEALATIREECSVPISRTTTAIHPVPTVPTIPLVPSIPPRPTSISIASLGTAKIQGALKYLAFLADGNHLYDAALGCCDFEVS